MDTAVPVHHVIAHSGKAPHLEHFATINNVITPIGLHSKVAVCRCGKLIRHFRVTDDISRKYTDGTTFMIPCPACGNE